MSNERATEKLDQRIRNLRDWREETLDRMRALILRTGAKRPWPTCGR